MKNETKSIRISSQTGGEHDDDDKQQDLLQCVYCVYCMFYASLSVYSKLCAFFHWLFLPSFVVIKPLLLPICHVRRVHVYAARG